MKEHTRFAAIRERLERYEPPPGPTAWFYEFLLFGFKQAWACLFGGLILALLLGTYLYYPAAAPLYRYDFLTLAAVCIQMAMLGLRLETWEEARVIAVFHIVGTVMELFKTHLGSWEYPEPALLRIGGVPLFTGFMYAAVGSYIARVWRIFEFRFPGYPSAALAGALAVAIYLNFFAHHWLPDMRWVLLAAMVWLFRRTRVAFRVWQQDRSMPLLVGWFLVALFIWFAENIATLSHAWVYPSQKDGWQIVSPTKLVAWYLLMYISFQLVASVHRARGSTPESERTPAGTAPRSHPNV